MVIRSVDFVRIVQILNNETFHQHLIEEVDVEIRTPDGIRGEKVYIVDFNTPEKNKFLEKVLIPFAK